MPLPQRQGVALRFERPAQTAKPTELRAFGLGFSGSGFGCSGLELGFGSEAITISGS